MSKLRPGMAISFTYLSAHQPHRDPRRIVVLESIWQKKVEENGEDKSNFRGVDLMIYEVPEHVNSEDRERDEGKRESSRPAIRTFLARNASDCKILDTWKRETWEKLQPWLECARRDDEKWKDERKKPSPDMRASRPLDDSDSIVVSSVTYNVVTKSSVWWKVVADCAEDLCPSLEVKHRQSEGQAALPPAAAPGSGPPFGAPSTPGGLRK